MRKYQRHYRLSPVNHIFLERGLGKVIISEEKWRVFEACWRNVDKCSEVKNGKWSVMKYSEVKWKDVKWSEVMMLSEMCVLKLIYCSVAARRFCAVHCLFNFASLCYFLIIRRLFYYSFYVFLFCNFYFIFCVFWFFVLFLFCTVSFLFFYKSTDRFWRVETQLQ